MGGGASIHQNTPDDASHLNRSRNSSPKKSIQDQFHKEFGKTSVHHEKRSSENIQQQQVKNVKVYHEMMSGLNPAVFKAKRLFMRPILKKKPIVQKLVIKKQNNALLLKEMFQRLDPSLPTSNVSFVTGELEVAVKYKILQGVLLVKIGRAKRLKTDVMGRPNPYVAVEHILSSNPDNKTQQRTASKERDSEPYFHEILSFPLDERHLAESRLNISVWDSNVLGYDDFLGEAVLDICKLDLNAGENVWYQLRPKIDESITGSIDVSVTFTPPNVVGVTLHEANNLKVANKFTGSSNPFARVCVSGLPHRMETKVIDRNLNPEWEQRFEFLIHQDEFPKRIIAVNIFSREGNNANQSKRLGDVHIPLCDFEQSSSGERHTYCLQDLRHTPYVRSKWVEDGIAMEFHEAMRAHATYALPSFVFKQQHKGKMLLSVRSSQAKSHANMVIMNGTPAEDHAQM